MQSDIFNKSTVRIFGLKSNVVGCGIFFAGRIFTCAHVVNQAIGAVSTSTVWPVDFVNFDFPLLRPKSQLLGRVIDWQPSEDIAKLEIFSNELSQLPEPKFIISDDLWGHHFRTFGFPRGLDEGVWASGQILHKVSNGWIEIEDMKEYGYFVQPGFSGSAVWDEKYSGIAGMIVGADANVNSRIAFIIPTSKLVQIFPEISSSTFNFIDSELDQVRELIYSGSFTDAYEKCKLCLQTSPSHSLLNLFSAVCLLNGKAADRQSVSRLVKIENHLSTAIASLTIRPTALAILGIVKYDYYVANGLDEGTPSIEEIKRDLHNFSQVDKFLLKSIVASDNALNYLRLR